MGRAARECTEPRGDCSGTARLRSLRRRERPVLPVATVDPGFEATTDLLSGREQSVVADAARRELHDAHRLVAIPVTACVRGRLVERLQALTVPPKPCHHQTPSTFRPAWEPGRSAGFRTLQTKPSSGLAPGLAGPGTPVPARGNEIPVCGLRLRDGGRAMSEDPAFVRAHLEQAMVLTVLGVCLKARLTP